MAECRRILVCGTPIGNAADAGRRLAAVLATADVVAAEDTRRLRRLAATLGIDLRSAGRLLLRRRRGARYKELLAAARAGSTVALVTDAGMPAVSDPGYRLVAAAAAAGIRSASSRDPAQPRRRWRSAGCPATGGCSSCSPAARARAAPAYNDLAAERRTIVLLKPRTGWPPPLTKPAPSSARGGTAVSAASSPRRTRRSSEAGWGELAAWADEREVLGEVTLVVAGAPAGPDVPFADELRDAVDALVRTGLSRRDAVAAVAKNVTCPESSFTRPR